MTLFRLVPVALAASLLAGLAAPTRAADTASKKIALSNNFAGNSWRQAMLKSWDKVTKDALAKKVVAQAPSFTTSENQATEQAAQIQNMILQGYDAIVIDAASPTAVNGAVKQACDAGIVVVSFDGIVTEPCAWRIAIDFAGMGKTQMEYLAGRMQGGKLLEIRGMAGVFVDDEIHKGIEDGVKAHSGFSIAGSVHGDWTQTVAQREVAVPRVHARQQGQPAGGFPYGPGEFGGGGPEVAVGRMHGCGEGGGDPLGVELADRVLGAEPVAEARYAHEAESIDDHAETPSRRLALPPRTRAVCSGVRPAITTFSRSSTGEAAGPSLPKTTRSAPIRSTASRILSGYGIAEVSSTMFG